MNFNKHHNSLKEKLQKDINLIKILSPLGHGINPNIAINIFKSTIKSKLDYSSLFTANSSKKNLQTTQTIQNSAIRTALGLTKTTPIVSIHNLSGIIPREFQNELNLANYFAKRLLNDEEFDLEDSIYTNYLEKYPCLRNPETHKSIKNENWERWSTRYSTQTTEKPNHLNSIWKGPMKSPWFKKSKLKNRQIKTMNRLLTNHTYNNTFLHIIKARDNDKCELCGEKEDNNHILFNCKNLDSSRNNFRILKQYNNTIDLFKSINKNVFIQITQYLDVNNKNI